MTRKSFQPASRRKSPRKKPNPAHLRGGRRDPRGRVVRAQAKPMTPVSSDELAKAVQQRNLAHLSHVTADQYACITDWSGNTLLHQAAAHGLCLGIPGATADRLRQVRNVNGGTPIHNAFWADQLHTIPGLTLSLLHQLKLGGETLLDWAMRRPGDQFVPQTLATPLPSGSAEAKFHHKILHRLARNYPHLPADEQVRARVLLQHAQTGGYDLPASTLAALL